MKDKISYIICKDCGTKLVECINYPLPTFLNYLSCMVCQTSNFDIHDEFAKEEENKYDKGSTISFLN